MRPESWALDLLDLVVGAERHASSPGDRPGGEWDPWLSLPVRTRQSLTGAGWATRGGMHPDVLADKIRQTYGAMSDAEALDWYLRHARVAVGQRRRLARWERERRLLRRERAGSYFEVRDRRARAAGYLSFWHQRICKQMLTTDAESV